MAFAEWLNQFQVNTTDSDGTQDDQWDQQVIQLANGNILVAWTSRADVGAGNPTVNDVIGRIFDPFGNVVENEFRINDEDIWNEQEVSLSALPGGGFVAAYARFEPALSNPDFGITVTIHNDDGSRADTLVIKTPTALDEWTTPKVAVFSDTLALVTYTLDGSDTFGQRFNPSTGTLIGGEFSLADLGAGDDQGSDMVFLPIQNMWGFVFADDDSTSDELHFNAIQSDGTKLLASDLILANSSSNIIDPSMTALDNGKVVVTWTVGNNNGIRLSIVDSFLQSAGPVLNPVTADTGSEHSPEVVGLDASHFLVAWYDVSTHDIRAQRYDDDGVKIGGEEVIVSYTNFEARDIEMTRLEDGRISVTWTQQDGSDDDVFMAIWDPRDEPNTDPAYPEGAIIGTPGDDTINPVPDDANSVYGVDGNDTFWVEPIVGSDVGTLFGVDFDGGNGTDTLGLLTAGLYDARQSNLVSIETLKFNAGSDNGLRNIIVSAEQSEMFDTINFAQGGSLRPDTLQVTLDNSTTLDLSATQFVDYDAAYDRIIIYGSAVSDQIKGTTKNDEIFTSGGLFDTLDAWQGVDTLKLGLQFNGTTTVNLLNETATQNGNDLAVINFENVEGSTGRDIITGNNGANVLMGMNGSDDLDGGDGQDQLIGGSGNDTLFVNHLDATFGPEVYDGGTGTDTLTFQGGSGAVHHDLQGDSLTSIDKLRFGTIATNGDRTIELSGDQMGAGLSLTANIRGVHASGKTETLRINMANATTLDLSGLTFTNWGNQGETVIVNGDGDSETITGTGKRDDISGGAGDDIIAGGDGDDILNGGVDEDVLDGNEGADVIRGGDQNDVLRGGLGTDDMQGGANDDTVQGGNGIDIMDGGNGTDILDLTTGYTAAAIVDLTLGTVTSGVEVESAINFESVYGTAFGDTVTGATAAASLLGFDGDDTLTGSALNDEIDGGNHNDIIKGGAGADDLDGGANTDTLVYTGSTAGVTIDLALNTASGGDATGDIIANFERVTGSDHDDTFIGSSIANRFIGGLGRDTMTGAGGADIFRFEATAESLNLAGDTITDFVQGSDVIDLAFIDADTVAVGNNAFVLTASGGTAGFTGLGQIRYFVGAQNTTISINTTGDNTPDMQIVLTGQITLQATDFIL